VQFAHSSSFKPMQGAEAEAEGSAGDLKSLGDSRKRSTALRIILEEEAARVPRRRRWDGAGVGVNSEPAATLTAELLSKWRSRLKFHDGFS
jgi:hypothetical protein